MKWTIQKHIVVIVFDPLQCFIATFFQQKEIMEYKRLAFW